MFEDVQRLIEQAKVAFPKFGNGVSSTVVAEAEKRLAIPLPESYKWWLLNYGGGQIGGDIVYGLDEGGMGRPDIVELAQANEQDGFHGLERLVFSIGNEENYYLDTTEGLDESREYRVYLQECGQEPVEYANSFADFLQRRIKEVYRM